MRIYLIKTDMKKKHNKYWCRVRAWHRADWQRCITRSRKRFITVTWIAPSRTSICMYMNVALIFALETKCWGNICVAFLFRVSLCRMYIECLYQTIYGYMYVIDVDLLNLLIISLTVKWKSWVFVCTCTCICCIYDDCLIHFV